MIYRQFTINIRNKEDADLLDKLPDGEKNQIIIELIRKHVERQKRLEEKVNASK